MAMAVVAVLGGSVRGCGWEREVTAQASQARVGLLWSRGCRVVVVEGGKVVVRVVVASVAVRSDGLNEVRPSRMAVVDHDCTAVHCRSGTL